MIRPTFFVIFTLACSTSSPIDGGVDATSENAASSDGPTDVAQEAPQGSCTHNAQCTSGECIHDNCGPGTCLTGVGNCSSLPTCGCDKKTYATECEAISADVGIAYSGACE
jgi:hypothetical protein